MRPFNVLYWLTPPALGAVLYGPAVTLPFFWDDVPNFQSIFNRSLVQLWLDASGLPYYRPLQATVLRLLQLLGGPANTTLFHAVNIFAWVGAAWLAGVLARQLARADGDLVAWLASALFMVFPFAPQAIAWVTALSHPLVTLLTLAACVCLLEFDGGRGWPWAVTALACAGLAPFAGEAGVVTAGLLGLCWLAKNWPAASAQGQLPGPKRAVLGLIALALLLNAAYLPIWASIPKDRSAAALTGIDWESIGQTAVFFLEGLTYPVQILARPLMSFGLTDLWAAAGLGLLALVGAAAALADRRWLAWALGYCCVAGLPVAAALPFAYTITSPRLMSITAPAAAVLWAAVAVEAVRRFPRGDLRPAAAALLAGAAALAPAWHINRQIALHHLALDQVWDLVREVQAHPAEMTLVVNAVDWVAPVQADYALGHEGVEVMPGYTTPRLLVWAHTQQLYDVEAVTFPLVFRQLQTLYFDTWGDSLDWDAMAGRARQAGRILVVSYADDAVELHPVGRIIAAAGQRQVSFADRIWLTRVNYGRQERVVEVKLAWRVVAASTEDIFANVIGCDGQVLGLSGGASLGGIYPIWLWRPGETIDEVRRIPVDPALARGCYRLELGLFDPATGARTEAFDSGSHRLTDDVFVVQWSEPSR